MAELAPFPPDSSRALHSHCLRPVESPSRLSAGGACAIASAIAKLPLTGLPWRATHLGADEALLIHMTLRRVGLARPAPVSHVARAVRCLLPRARRRRCRNGGRACRRPGPGTGLEVHAEDRETWEWRKKGHNGNRTLVCLACYQGADLPDGPRVVALVPKGREGGARCRHFAHPPGMAPPSGRHHPESLEPAHGKQALRRWAIEQGFTAQVEARTADGQRRSDVEVILPGAPAQILKG